MEAKICTTNTCNTKICTANVIEAKIKRPDFILKMMLCVILFLSTLYQAIETLEFCYMNVEGERGNLLMYLILVFTDPDMAYYTVLVAFAILVSDIVYEQYLTKEIYVMYGSRRKVYFGMIKLIAFFSFLFICLYFLMAVLVGVCGGIDLSFHLTENAIMLWAQEQDFYLIRSSAIYIPATVVQYNGIWVLGMIVVKYYVGLVLLAMTGLLFSIRKDSAQIGTLAIMLTLLFNIALLEYYGPWKFYKLGILVDLSGIFSYLTLQRFFMYDWAGIKEDVAVLFRDTILTGGVWFMALSVIIYRILKKKDL